MPDRRREPRQVPRPRTLDPRREAGQRLKRALHVARAKAGITSDIDVSVRSHVSYDTLMNWYSGRTTPRPHELQKVTQALGASYAEVWAVYEGVDPEPLPLHESIRELVVVLRDLALELRHSRAEALVTQEQMAEALRLADGITRASSTPRPRTRPVGER